jgi:hypothetical protein
MQVGIERMTERGSRAINAPKILFPKSLEEFIEICKTRIPSEPLRAAGSH